MHNRALGYGGTPAAMPPFIETSVPWMPQLPAHRPQHAFRDHSQQSLTTLTKRPAFPPATVYGALERLLSIRQVLDGYPTI
jgi:hypothetical protein